MAARVDRTPEGVTSREATPPDGVGFPVFEQGEGRPILILHPGSGDWTSWQFVSRRLRLHFRVLSFDRRPYRAGLSPRASSMSAEVADVLAAAALAREPVLLVGHSSGAVVALEAALANASAFAGLVLYEPPVAVDAPLGGEALVRARAALDAGDPGEAMAIHVRDIVRAPAPLLWLQRLSPMWRRMRSYAEGQIRDDEQIESLGVGIERYRAIRLPVLLLGGEKSVRHLRERLAALSDVLPCVDSVVVLPGQGHLANVFAPGRLAEAIEAFADRVFDGS